MDFLIFQMGCLVVLGLYLLLFCKGTVHFVCAVLIYALSALFTLAYLVADSFTGAGITEAVLFHLMYGFTGVDVSLVMRYLLLSICFFLGLVASIFLFARLSRRRRGACRYQVAEFVALLGIGLFAVGLHPAVLQAAEIASSMLRDPRISLDDELARFHGQSQGSGKSLVYIYVESLERTFLKEELFPDLAPQLASLERRSLHIKGIHQAPLTEWTIAGMAASQCGMPLATFRDNRNDFSGVEQFMPGATCLGDILKQAGYYSVYMGGANLDFAGKRQFYLDHGFDEILGKEDLQAMSPEELPLSKWGVHDDFLLEKAYEKFKQLSGQKRPFALFLLTLDTHPPSGHETPACKGEQYGDGQSGILNAVKCADRLVSEFVKKIEAYAGDDLMVIVASDHMQMRNDISELLAGYEIQRENLFFVRGAGVNPGAIERSATTLDIFPTVLHLLGWEVRGAALGRNLLSAEETLSERYGRQDFYQALQQWRLQLWKVWSSRSERSYQ